MLSIYLLLSSPLLPLPIKLLHLNFMYVFMFWVPCHDLCYDFHVNTMFESSWLPFVLYVLFILLLFICVYWCSTPFRSLVFPVMLCRSLFVLFLLAIELSIFRFAGSDYPFDIFKVSQFSGCWLILSVYMIMSLDFPFVRLFGVR